MYVVFQNTPEVCNFSIDLTKSSSVFLIDVFFGAKIQHWETRGQFLLVAVFLRRRGGRFGTLHVPAIDRAPSPPCPCEPEIPFGRSLSPSLVSAVTSVSAIPFRHDSLAKRNGAFAVRYCLRLRVTRSIVNHCAIGTPSTAKHRPGEQPMHHSVWPKMAQRETQVQTTNCKTGIGLQWQECQTESHTRQGS